MSYLRSLFCSTHKCNDLTLVRASRPSGASRPCLCAAPLARHHRRPTVSDMLFREPNTQHVTHQNRMALRFWSLRKLPRHAGTRLHTSVSNWLSRVQPPKPTHVDGELPLRVLLLFSNLQTRALGCIPCRTRTRRGAPFLSLSSFARMAHHTGRHHH
jgi:hypothetical protein